MQVNELRNFAEDRVLFHGSHLLRATARMSTEYAGNCTVLREPTRSAIPLFMTSAPSIDLDKLRADMALAVDATSGRKFSLKATGGKNPDFYRNFVNDGRDKRMSADVFVGIVNALEKNPAEYVIGMSPSVALPNANALTQAFAILLETVGIDPYQDERAQKLARLFPDALQRVSALREGLLEDFGSDHEEDAPGRDAGRTAA